MPEMPGLFAVFHLGVRQSGLAGRAPVDRSFGPIGQPPFIQLEKQPLGPFIICLVAGHDHIVKVIRGAHFHELFLHTVDVAVGGILGVNPRFDRVVFRRQAECVKALGMEKVESLHFFRPGPDICQSIIIPMPDMELRPGRIGKHLQAIELVVLVRIKSIEFLLFPTLLPFFINVFAVCHRLALSQHFWFPPDSNRRLFAYRLGRSILT